MSFLLAMHSSASMLKQMFVQPTPPLHTAVAGAKSQYVTPFIAMYYVVLTPSSAAQAARALWWVSSTPFGIPFRLPVQF